MDADGSSDCQLAQAHPPLGTARPVALPRQHSAQTHLEEAHRIADT